MNTGLLYKTMREITLITVICGIGLFIFEAAVTYIFWTYQEEFTGDVLQIQFISDIVNSMIGARMGGAIGPSTLQSLAWVHPLVLALFFTQVVTACTRIPAGEIDAGTADVLLALPVSRWTIYCHEAIAWLASGLALVTMAFLGYRFGSLFIPSEGRIPIRNILTILLNLYALYVFVGAMASCFAARASSRGRAVGVSVGVLLVFFIWNFLGQYWGPSARIEWLNILSYYKPMPMLDDATIPWKNLAVLSISASILWTLGGIQFHRRDISTL